MDNALNSLFPLTPNEGTLACLVHRVVNKFGNQVCLQAGIKKVTYLDLDNSSDDIAAFLRGNGYQRSHILFVKPGETFASCVVMLAGIKSGMTLTEPEKHLAEGDIRGLFKKSVLTFANGTFEDQHKRLPFSDALKLGKSQLFFNIPRINENDAVFVSFTCGYLNPEIISHKYALLMTEGLCQREVPISFIRFLSCWKDNRPY